MNRDQILRALVLEEPNAGAYAAGWIPTTGALLTSIDPATEQPIASVQQATVGEYEAVVANSMEVFEEWRMVPAPERGGYVRRLANALRDYKDPLGSLVA